MTERIFPNFYRIHVPLAGNPLKELNCYLIRGEDSDLLIDTGFRQTACREALQAALAELSVSVENTDVLLTHLHADHSGLCDVFSGPDRKIYISEIDRLHLQDSRLRQQVRQEQDDRCRAEGFPEEELQQLVWKNPARSSAAPDGIDRFCGLQDGDVLQIGGYALQAILTPGHTPGHMCFYLQEQRAMLLGDHVLFDITPNITFWASMPDALGTYLQSLRQIASCDVDTALPGHRQSGCFHRRIEELLAHHRRRLEQVLRIVEENPGLTGYEIAARMRWRIRCSSWEDFPVAQKWFAVGEALSHLDHLLVLGKLRIEEKHGKKEYFPA